MHLPLLLLLLLLLQVSLIINRFKQLHFKFVAFRWVNTIYNLKILAFLEWISFLWKIFSLILKIRRRNYFIMISLQVMQHFKFLLCLIKGVFNTYPVNILWTVWIVNRFKFIKSILIQFSIRFVLILGFITIRDRWRVLFDILHCFRSYLVNCCLHLSGVRGWCTFLLLIIF